MFSRTMLKNLDAISDREHFKHIYSRFHREFSIARESGDVISIHIGKENNHFSYQIADRNELNPGNLFTIARPGNFVRIEFIYLFLNQTRLRMLEKRRIHAMDIVNCGRNFSRPVIHFVLSARVNTPFSDLIGDLLSSLKEFTDIFLFKIVFLPTYFMYNSTAPRSMERMRGNSRLVVPAANIRDFKDHIINNRDLTVVVTYLTEGINNQLEEVKYFTSFLENIRARGLTFYLVCRGYCTQAVIDEMKRVFETHPIESKLTVYEIAYSGIVFKSKPYVDFLRFEEQVLRPTGLPQNLVSAMGKHMFGKNYSVFASSSLKGFQRNTQRMWMPKYVYCEYQQQQQQQ